MKAHKKIKTSSKLIQRKISMTVLLILLSYSSLSIASVNPSQPCLECLYGKSNNSLADTLSVIAGPIAFLGAAYFGAKYQSQSQQAWANASAAGPRACQGTITSYQAANLARGGNPILPAQLQSLMSTCNRQSFGAGGYAGMPGMVSNGYGGFGNPMLSAGYTTGMSSAMMGPYGQVGVRGTYRTGALGNNFGSALGLGLGLGAMGLLGGNGAGLNVQGGLSLGTPGIYGNAGMPGIYGNGATAGIYGNAGMPGVYGNGATAGVYGNAGMPRVYGNAGMPRIYGNAGMPRVYGNAGMPGVYGNAGMPGIYGNAGAYPVSPYIRGGVQGIPPFANSGSYFNNSGGFQNNSYYQQQQQMQQQQQQRLQQQMAANSMNSTIQNYSIRNGQARMAGASALFQNYQASGQNYRNSLNASSGTYNQYYAGGTPLAAGNIGGQFSAGLNLGYNVNGQGGFFMGP